ncbi:hypothetical protein G7068_13390 [Leucobacter viscericola]|uniref:Uncharacterized protein n=1 Tax=Leucobacter viscericola TaxID=2714935 RepID=A0A6G7XI73_9MICO|nr:hypothetical protein [Leucobacter viscericola]QIK64077.1 hypothetical protein G7068_13390 [Leucobacter viscericola]
MALRAFIPTRAGTLWPIVTIEVSLGTLAAVVSAALFPTAALVALWPIVAVATSIAVVASALTTGATLVAAVVAISGVAVGPVVPLWAVVHVVSPELSLFK